MNPHPIPVSPLQCLPHLLRSAPTTPPPPPSPMMMQIKSKHMPHIAAATLLSHPPPVATSHPLLDLQRNPSPHRFLPQNSRRHRRPCNTSLQGWTVDKNTVIGILAHRTAYQRREIMSSYKMLYKESLVKRLESKLSGNLKKAMLPWILDPNDRQAALASLAVKENNPVNYRVIIEIACINSPDELLAVKKAYQAQNEHCSLEEDVAFHTNGNLYELLFSLLHADRFDGKEANLKLASTEAKILHDDIKGKSSNHAEIIRIFSTRSKAQLRATFSRYKIDYGTSITKDLNRKPPSEFIDALKITIRCIECPQKYFAKVLHNAISNGECILDAFNEDERVASCIKVFDTGKSVGDEDNLTRVFVTRAEKDLNEIKQMFEERTNTTLRYAVTKKASGSYQRFLLALLGVD